jgi:exonuclease SbcC
MIIKSLKLENIRSYVEGTVEFPLGTTLFEGDIGSGKSTLLMAIEFALFGLGSEKGGALLRAGMKNGSVSLEFSVDGQQFKIYRSLERKGKGVQFGEAILTTKEGTLTLSAKEMKEKVLEILGFNEPPDPKARSVIYRYAVFTPQEEMKEVLLMQPDSRLQTLRKAFRIEDYRTAMSNASSLVKLIEKEANNLSTLSNDLEEKVSQSASLKSEAEGYQEELKQQQEKEKCMELDYKKLKSETDRLQNEKERLYGATVAIPLLTKEIEEKDSEILELQNESEGLTKEVEETLKPSMDKFEQIEKPTSKSAKTLEEELRELRKLETQLNRREGSIEDKITDYKTVEKKKKCPTCDRPADPSEFKLKIELKIKEKDETSSSLESCGEKITRIEKLLKSLEKYDEAQERLKDLNLRETNNDKKIQGNMKKIGTLKGLIEKAKKQLGILQKQSQEYEKISRKVSEDAKKLADIEADLTETRKIISSTDRAIKDVENRARELDEEIKQKQAQRRFAGTLSEYRIWVDEFFIPTLDNIEKHVMLAINQDFNQHFQKWFGLLIEDPGKDARIDEEFTPIIEQDGYEQDIYYLSGGERTSVALAYRLALNTIVQKVSAGMKSNLLILDEPTDGLSKEQLFKVREILNEIKCPQVIIVSHERELESFADRVLKVEKTQGVSTVASPT